MARYTTVSSRELTEIVSHYDIGTPLTLEDIPGGFGNSNFKLTTTAGTLLLKICDEKTQAELHAQIALLVHLRKHAYPTVYPILQKNGGALHVRQTDCVMLYPFLQGTTPQPSERTLACIGEALAKLHCLPPLEGLPCFPMGVSQIVPFFAEVEGTQFATHPFVLRLKSDLEQMRPQLAQPLPAGILHGDLFLDNTLFEGEQLVAILDFEEACADTLLIDVGMTIIGCCYTAQHDLHVAAVHSFLNAYNASRPLTADEWESLDCFVHYAASAIAFWRFRQFNIRRPDARRADTYQEMIERSEKWQSKNF